MNVKEMELVEDKIDISAWQQACQDNEDIAADVALVGISMSPMLRSKKDGIRIVPLRRQLVLGDIVMFHTKQGKIVTHRVCKLEKDTLQTQGDNCKIPDAPIPYDYVYGLVTHIHRGKRLIFVDTPGWRRYGRFMYHTTPVRMFLRDYIKRPVFRLGGKVLRALKIRK